MRRQVHLMLTALLLGSILIVSTGAGQRPVAQAAPIANDPFQRTWQRTDKPVSDGAVQRTWMWGIEPFTEAKTEAYAESPEGERTVQYFDKSRMEITNPGGDQSSPWYVTNGLLVVELMTGKMQVGDNQFEDRAPAQINVAGDPDDPLTYAVLAGLRGNDSLATGAMITQRVDASGQVTDDPGLASHGVTAMTHVPDTNHTVASPFWDFMTASGVVYENGGTTTAPLFESAFYATGFPITEAYWANVKVGGTQREVLLQCFERRCLTYTPGNDPAWQVEAGNVGQHYYRWRYPEADPGPNEQANELARKVTQAGSDEARYSALLEVMAALNVGVYTGDGQRILGGAERAAADFYLYDIEVQMMAAALGRGDTWGVEDIAHLLTDLPILEGGAAVDPELLRQILIEGVQSASQTPGDPLSLTPLIVRQLGLGQAQPYDLLNEVPLSTLRFDALGYFLILADFLAPMIAEAGPVASGGSQLVAESRGMLKAAATDNPCDTDVGIGVKESWPFGKWLLGFIEKIGKPTTLGAVAIDAIHGAVLAFSVRVQEMDQRLETHYGHDGPGQELQFRIKVEMLDALPENLVKCGWLLGVEFPKQGGIRDVSMIWFEGELANHGEIVCGEACQKTDDQGIATLIFRPKQEVNPGEGNVVTEIGTVTGVAMYLSKHGNMLGTLNQVATPKYGMLGWMVEHHEMPGYKITFDMIYDVGAKIVESDVTSTYTASGQASFTVWVVGEAVNPPHNWGVDPWLLFYTASGSGSFSITHVTQADVLSCSGGWSGTYNDSTHYSIYTNPADDGPVTKLQINLFKAPDGNYTASGGACPGGVATDIATYLAITRNVPRDVDLTNRAVQTFTIPTSEGCANLGFASCSGSSQWNVYVEVTQPAD